MSALFGPAGNDEAFAKLGYKGSLDASEVADRIIFMDHGQITEEGTPEEIIRNSSNPRVKEFFSKVL